MEIELKLTILERISIPMSLLPPTFNLDDGIAKREIAQKIELTKAEKEKINHKDLKDPMGGPGRFSAWGSFLKCKKCGTVFKDPYDDLKLAELSCDECGNKEFEKFEQYTELSKVFKFSKSEIFFLDKQVTRLHDDGKVEDRILDVCLKVRELMKEIPKGLQKAKETTVKKRP